METDIQQVRAMRRGCSRIGLALMVGIAMSYLAVWVLEMGLFVVYPQALYHMPALLLLSDLCTYGLGGVTMWLLLRPLPRTWVPQRSITPGRLGKLSLECIGGMYSTSLLTTLVVVALSQLTGQEWTNQLISTIDELSLGSLVFFMVLVAPVCEELLFRRLLFRHLLPMGQGFAVVISALAFGLFHCNLFQFFYATALGLIFGCVVAKTGRIRYTILLHAMINLLGSVVVTAIEPYPMLESIYVMGVYTLMFVGLGVLIRDRHSLWPRGRCLPGCYRAAFTSVGWMVCVVVFGAMSVMAAIY